MSAVLATVVHPRFRSVTVETVDPKQWMAQGWLPVSVRPPEDEPVATIEQSPKSTGRRRKK